LGVQNFNFFISIFVFREIAITKPLLYLFLFFFDSVSVLYIFTMEFTEMEQTQLVNVCKELGSKPKFDSKDDFIKWMREFISAQDSAAEVKPDGSVLVAAQGNNSTGITKEVLPRVPIFSGSTPTKSDHVPFEVWYHELQCLLKQKKYSTQTILNAARLSLRGEASKVAVRLGTEATVEQLIEKIRHLYGSVDSGEELLAKFYSANQTKDETVVQWSCRLEDLMAAALQAGHFAGDSSREVLRSKFWGGLKHPLRELSSHKFDQIADYEKLLVEVRKIENSLSPNDDSSVTVQPKKGKVHTQQAATTEAVKGAEVASVSAATDNFAILQQLQAQVSAMATELQKLKPSEPSRPPSRKPKCWRCGKYGHMQSACRNVHLPLNSHRPALRGDSWSQTPKSQ
jgi:hypothetical protein